MAPVQMATDQEQSSGAPAKGAASERVEETLLEQQAILRQHAAALDGPLASGQGGQQELRQASGQHELRKNDLLQEFGQRVTAQEETGHEASGPCEANLVGHASASQALVMNLADGLLAQSRPEPESEPETHNEAVVCRMDCAA